MSLENFLYLLREAGKSIVGTYDESNEKEILAEDRDQRFFSARKVHYGKIAILFV